MKLKRWHFPLFLLILALQVACADRTSEANNTARRQSYDKLLADAQQHQANQVYDRAFYYYNKAKRICTSTDEPVRIIYPLISMAGIQQMQGDFAGSETTAVEALRYLTKDVDAVYKVSVYNQLGIAYEQQLDFENAIQSYQSALQCTKGEHEKAIVKNNLAVVEMDHSNFSKAVNMLLPLLNKQDVLANAETHARILDNIGFCYFNLNSIDAIRLLNQAKDIRIKINDDFGLVASYFHLSKYHENTAPELARQYAISSYNTAAQIQSADDKLEALDAVIKNTNGEEAKRYSIAYIKLNDSLTKARQSAKNQFAKIRYDDEETQKENAYLKAVKETQEYKNALLILVIIFIFILGLVSYFFMLKRHRREKVLEAYKTEMHIATRIHDEIANDVHNIMTFAGKHYVGDSAEKETLLSNLDELYSRARNISRASSPVNTSENYPIQLREMLTQYNSKNTKLVIQGLQKMPWEKVTEERKIAIHRILQELLVNMKKHSRAENVVLQFEIVGRKLQIAYTDNGVGMQLKPTDFKNGLRNVENRIKAIGGKISFDSEPQKGLQVTITCPVEN